MSISRNETYEEIILGEQLDMPNVIDNIDKLFTAIINRESELPVVPKTSTEKYLANLIDNTVEIPAPISRVDRILYSICMNETLEGFTPLSRNEELLYEILVTGALASRRTVEGIILYLYNSTGDDLVSYSITGATEQDGTPTPEAPIDIENCGDLNLGKNLIPYPYLDTTLTRHGITFTDNGDGTITANGTATTSIYLKLNNVSLKKGSYIISDELSGVSFSTYGVYIAIDEKSYISSTASPFVLSEDMTGVAYLFVKSGITVDNMLVKPMVRSSSIIDSTYVPYHEPTYDLPIKASGKNLFDKTAATIGKYINGNTGDLTTGADYSVSDYINVISGTSICFTIPFTSAQIPGYAFYNQNYEIVGNSKYTSSFIANPTTVIPDTAVYVRFTTLTANLDDTMLELGTSKTDYEPFHEDVTTTITLPQPLRLNDVAYSNGDVERHRAVKVFDGTENILSYSSGLYFLCFHKIKKCYCTHYIDSNGSTTSGFFTGLINRSALHFFVQDTPNEFKAYLAEQYANGTPVTVEYELATPVTAHEFEPPAIPTFEGTTIISCETETQPSDMTAEYYSTEAAE